MPRLSIYNDEAMIPRTFKAPLSYYRVLLVHGEGNMSRGIRSLIETHLSDLLIEDKAVCEELFKDATPKNRNKLVAHLTSLPTQGGVIYRKKKRKSTTCRRSRSRKNNTNTSMADHS